MPESESSKNVVKKDKEDENELTKTVKEPEEIDSDLPEEIAEVLEDMSPKVRRSITMAMTQMSTRGSAAHPLFEKFTEEHITKFLDYSQKDDDNEFKYKSSNRWFYFLYSILGVGLFIFLITYLLPQNKELLLDIFKLFVAFIGGLGIGYGLKILRK
jgi:hypothetical protein